MLLNLNGVLFQDRLILHRLEHVCHTIEHGEWPSNRRLYKNPALDNSSLSDSRASTPLATGEFSVLNDGVGSVVSVPSASSLIYPSSSNAESVSTAYLAALAAQQQQARDCEAITTLSSMVEVKLLLLQHSACLSAYLPACLLACLSMLSPVLLPPGKLRFYGRYCFQLRLYVLLFFCLYHYSFLQEIFKIPQPNFQA